ncbi:Mrp/NBP35 family ATP-binding protein [Lacibacterium aquatile]|uniref:Iron-sulfur cluster carrier protein n=1 Tax=Lacibacterium aquatile TaxID=1168082 RepID=A0ABW5DK42_9PROT
MSDQTQAETFVQKALDTIVDPGRGQGLVASGRLEGLVVKDGNVAFALKIQPSEAPTFEPLRKAAEQAVLALPGIKSVSAVLTAEKAPAAPAAQPQRPTLLPDVKFIVAVASGKGGVGKSTVATNLAVALAGQGLKVGLLDADVFGPSGPRMMGLAGRPEITAERKLVPPVNHGVKVMSIGFLVPDNEAVVWRGPMVMGALEQMMKDVAWGALDILVVDMPPGTGDAQLTMAQRVPLAGAVIVSTPQDVALLDARKGIAMFKKVAVPILGLIENMSYFSCPACGHRTDIFAHGGARHEAETIGAPFLGEIPIETAVRVAGDSGSPIVAANPESSVAGLYRDMAAKLWAGLNAGAEAPRPAPTIRMG